MATSRFQVFVAPARARPQLWRLIVGLALVVLIYVTVVLGTFAAIWALTETDPRFSWAESILRAETPFGLLVLLGTFSGMALGVFAAARLLHKRGPGTLFGPAPRALRDFCLGAGVYLPLLGLSVIGWTFFYDARPGLDPNSWLMVLPLAVIGILIQTGAEELLFRGYLQQQLAARFNSALVWAVGPALLFGVAHYRPGISGENAWLVVAATGTFGLIAADLTARTGSIGAAWGFHFANNSIALLLVATQGTLTGLALFQTPYSAADAETFAWLVPLDLAVMLLGWVLVRRLVSLR